jgi:cytochrome P450
MVVGTAGAFALAPAMAEGRHGKYGKEGAKMQTEQTHSQGGSAGAETAAAIFNDLFYTGEGRTNPYPLYRRLREADPVHHSSQGMWILTRYDDCWATLRDPRFGKNYPRLIEQRFGTNWRDRPALASGEHSMLNVSGAEHTRLRKLVAKGFTPRMIQRLDPSIERAVAELLEPFVEAGGGDILEAVGFPLPVTIIGEMLGVPAEDRGQFRQLVREFISVLEMRPTAEQIAAADAAQIAMNDYFMALIAEKRRRPDEGLLSALAQVEDRGDRLSDDELARLAQLLFAAGF